MKPLIGFRCCLLMSMVSGMTAAGLIGLRRADAGEVGRGARLFVTKAYPGHGQLTDRDFQQLADAGFTVAVMKWNGNLQAYCDGAARAGLAAMTFQGGMGDAVKGDEVDRTMTRKGKTTRYALPFSQAGWGKVTERLVAQAKLSLTATNLKGAILDFEIYDKNKTDGFCESYDDATFAAFLRQIGKPVPSPLPPAAERRAYLDRLQILPLYIQSQARRVGERAAALRRAVDAVNPRFQIGVYGWGAFKEAVIRHVASSEAPALDLSAMTYGRTAYSSAFQGGYDADEPDRLGLKWSLITVATAARAAHDRGYPVVVLAGHYPQSPGPADGTQYRFTARQAFNSAAYADGYWIWTDWNAPKPWKSKQAWIDAMMAYWAKANAALDKGDWTWASRQSDSVNDPHPSASRIILTTDGREVRAWNPLTGEPIHAAGPTAWPKSTPPTTAGGRTFRIQGWQVRAIQDGKVVATYDVGHGTRAVAVGDVDRIPGDEVVTLNAGWIKIWDPGSESQLLRFYVGSDQKDLRIVDSPSGVAAE